MMANEFSLDSIQITIPKRSKNSHKGDFGRALILAGSEGMGGAAILSSEACLFSGAGLVSMYTHPSNVEASLTRNPEIMALGIKKDFEIPKNIDVLLCGPGLRNNEWSANIVKKAFTTKKLKILIFDAGAFDFLPDLSSKFSCHDSQIILTPHPGEAGKLLNISNDEVQKNREDSAKELSKKYNANVILKGKGTIVCLKDSTDVYICSEGGPELSTGGTGDVLAGVIAGLTSQKLSISDACMLSVAVHARAGEAFKRDIGEIGLNAGSLSPIIRNLLNRL